MGESESASESRLPMIVGVLAAAGIAALASWPAACRLLPVLGVFGGPLGGALVGVAVATAAVGVIPLRWPWPNPRLRPLAAFVVGVLVLVPVGLGYATRLRVSGDEPHYLLMAQSLWREGDLLLEDNLAREDYLEYTPGPVRPHYGAPRKDGRPYPAHSPGLPLLLAPVYALGGRLLCVALLGVVAAAAAARALSLAVCLGLREGPALLAWGAALGPPLLFYSFHVYTEAPCALAIVVALELLLVANPAPARAVGAALCAAALPWLHVKMLPVAAVLGVLGLLRLPGRARWAFLVTAGGMAVAYLGYHLWVFGQPTPLAIYGGGVPSDVAVSPLRALAGLLLDRSFGLWPHAPVLALAVLAGASLWSQVPAGRSLLAVIVAILLPVLFWRMWWGGQCPPARFLVPAAPLLAIAVGLASVPPFRGVIHWRWPLLGGGWALALFMTWDPGALLLLNRANRPTRLWAALSGETPIGRYLPSLTLPDAAEERVALVWVVALVALLALHALARRRNGVDRWFRSLALPLILGLGVGAAVDGWARRGEPPFPADEVSSVR